MTAAHLWWSGWSEPAHVLARAALAASVHGLPPTTVYAAGGAALAVAIIVAAAIGRRAGRRSLGQRLTALGTRLGIDTPEGDGGIETSLAYLEQVTGAAAEAVSESSADAIRLRRALDAFPQGVVLCDENGQVVYRNARANALMTSRHGEALAAQAVTELLEDAWDEGTAERTVDLYGPPRRTLTVRARQIDDGRRPLGVVAVIEDVSERRRLEDVRRDFVANVSHELKTPMGALGLLAETLVAEPDLEVARRLASRIHTEAFRVSRIIDDLLDLSRIESEQAPPREPVLVNLVMAEASERVRATAEQRGVTLTVREPDPPVAVLGDRRQLVSALHSLIENAVTYSYEHSTVTISAHVAVDEPGRAGRTGAARHATTLTLGNEGDGDGAGTGATSRGAAGADRPVAAGSAGSVEADGGSTGSPAVAPVPGAASAASPGDVHGDVHGAAHAKAPNAGPDGETVAGPDGETVAGPDGETGAGPDGETGAGPEGETGTAEATDSSVADSSTGGAGAWPGGGADPARDVTGTRDAEPPRDASAATDGGGRASATTPHKAALEVVRISVVDRGIGIPARDLDRIFERFYRVDQGRSRNTGGTGLGLSIVRHVASNHRGWVEVESREGEGSTFTLVLPLRPDRS